MVIQDSDTGEQHGRLGRQHGGARSLLLGHLGRQRDWKDAVEVCEVYAGGRKWTSVIASRFVKAMLEDGIVFHGGGAGGQHGHVVEDSPGCQSGGVSRCWRTSLR